MVLEKKVKELHHAFIPTAVACHDYAEPIAGGYKAIAHFGILCFQVVREIFDARVANVTGQLEIGKASIQRPLCGVAAFQIKRGKAVAGNLPPRRAR
ncbi:hypothetical protein [Bradyrhizobium sp. CB3481]|uniref:hypothetical protein n=1 Tax=Bradyrhizobium sp. CB3481 TaxID=3039158 RepID=UPI0024B0C86F|nr:hypothetical protein [Bradyrhizobium sp. CB3481]WFU14742.1 hypothetical protein QA643_27215 [Bradyrhizobium sp. CB3481]